MDCYSLKTGIKLGLCLLIILAQLLAPSADVLALERLAGSSATADNFTQQYTAITKQVLLKGVELERFSLNYRREAFKQPKFRRLRYFLTQETGASCILAFEIIADKQFGIRKHHPLRISSSALHGAFTTAMVGAIIAGAGSCLELSSNTLLAIENKRHGFDPASANRFVISRLKELDQLLAEREALVAAHHDHPGYARAVVEGRIISELRQAFINEYGHFHADARGYATVSNLFYVFNAATTAIGATAAGIAYKSVTEAKLVGPANILFIVTGSLAMASPLLSTAAGSLIRQHDYNSVLRKLGEKQKLDPSQLTADRLQLEQLLPDSQGSLMPALPAVDRLALYTESDQLFQKQLANETHILRHLEQVAIESNLLGPAIGGCLMTQGILGTVGYYKYTFRPRKLLNLSYNGAVIGTAGAGLAVVATAASLLASWSYENRLRKENRLPAQLIEQRLAHIDEVEKLILSL